MCLVSKDAIRVDAEAQLLQLSCIALTSSPRLPCFSVLIESLLVARARRARFVSTGEMKSKNGAGGGELRGAPGEAGEHRVARGQGAKPRYAKG
jgi:hypothetical protein